MKPKRLKRQPIIKGDVEKLENMIDHSIARRKTYKPTKRKSDEKALLEMIDTRISHMLTKSCELEAKLDTIESKKAKRQGKTNITSVKKSPSSQQSQSMVQTKQTITSVTKSKNNSSISEIIPKLASPSKVLIPEKPKAVISSDNKTIESLISFIQNLANEISEMHEEQNILKNQIEKMQECLFSDE